jgi:hypothetical protein
LKRTPRARQSQLPFGTWFRKRFQTSCTNNAVVVLCNTLAAKESSTFQASRDRLTIGMIQATQMSKIDHVSLRKIKRTCYETPACLRYRGGLRQFLHAT